MIETMLFHTKKYGIISNVNRKMIIWNVKEDVPIFLKFKQKGEIDMKKFSLFMLAILLVLSMVGCQESNNENINDNTTENSNISTNTNENVSENTEQNNEKPNLTVNVNTVTYKNNEFSVGESYEENKEKFGNEIKPSETAKVCDPNAKGDSTMYYYEGLTINTNYKGDIVSVSITSGDTEVFGGVKIGDSPEKCKEVLGEPVFESEYGANYSLDRYGVGLVLDDDGKISVINIEDLQAEM